MIVEAFGRPTPFGHTVMYDGADESVVVLTMTRQEIADYLGLTIETVSRVFSDLKRRGLITIEKQDRVRLTSVCGLCRHTGTH